MGSGLGLPPCGCVERGRWGGEVSRDAWSRDDHTLGREVRFGVRGYCGIGCGAAGGKGCLANVVRISWYSPAEPRKAGPNQIGIAERDLKCR